MTFTDPTPPTADHNSPAAVLERTRQAYADTGKRIEQLSADMNRLTLEHAAIRDAHHKLMVELKAELVATKAAHQQWGRMLPRGDTARNNGAQ